ncbi:hypothetical protein [Ramlibacter alkalitolerans]|uniref:Outer membrane protein beta-barrel domain-containing protein n=1 Tax=Ramlibacter alkalitolerans TaxID=2039631 RepID=A0ABS1JKH5_9BURK|nr:hypothetical protein [Ramlibacter alkalitolerans]MBL0424611.1 hypothetical protein [Ramlibacter alkalitolerans]
MRSASTLLPRCSSLAAAACLACGCAAVQAQALSANYTLTAPSLMAEPEVVPVSPLAAWGPVRLSGARSGSGSGLSLEAGENWFARAGLGRSLEGDALSLGGGYRFTSGEALSMTVTRQLGQERLGLAVRYDWRQSYLRLSYDQPLRTPGAVDRLRFSAGVRF